MKIIPNRSLFVDDINGAQSRKLHQYVNRRIPAPPDVEKLFPPRLNNYQTPQPPVKKQFDRALHNLSQDQELSRRKKYYPYEQAFMYGYQKNQAQLSDSTINIDHSRERVSSVVDSHPSFSMPVRMRSMTNHRDYQDEHNSRTQNQLSYLPLLQPKVYSTIQPAEQDRMSQYQHFSTAQINVGNIQPNLQIRQQWQLPKRNEQSNPVNPIPLSKLVEQMQNLNAKQNPYYGKQEQYQTKQNVVTKQPLYPPKQLNLIRRPRITPTHLSYANSDHYQQYLGPMM